MECFVSAQMVIEHAILPPAHFNRHYSTMKFKCIVDLLSYMSSFCFRIGRPRKSK